LVRDFINKFSIYQLMIITLLAALGIAIKTVIGPLVRLVTSPLLMPGGVVAGGIYMMFLVLAVSLTGKKSAGLLCGFVQALIVLVTGFGGHHGPLTLVSYTMPGVAILVLLLIMRHDGCCKVCSFFMGMVANLAGTLVVSAAFFALPGIPLLLSLAASSLSGGLGGLLAYSFTRQIKKLGIT